MMTVALSNEATPSNGEGRQPLCSRCCQLELNSIPVGAAVMTMGPLPHLKHHDSFRALEAAVREGCAYCNLFLRTVSNTYTKASSWCESKVIEYHRCRDQTDGAGFTITFDEWPVEPQVSGTQYLQHVGLLYVRHLPNKYIGRGISTSVDRGGPFAGFSDVSIYPRLSLVSLSGHHNSVVGRPISETADLKLALEWIHSCSTSHEVCGRDEEKYLPSRLIDVGGRPDQASPRLVETSGSKGTYVCLSHCWGGFQPLMTTGGNYKSHVEVIPFDSLPRTFQDAFTVTRQLGYHYIWVDSLCIIQDSAEDWQRECAQMARIYENAAVTLAGPAAATPVAGFLHPRNSIRDHSCRFRDGRDDTDLLLTLPSTSYRGSPHTLLEPDAPMAKRAWILQERLLSPRVLFFGSQQMYFECCVQQRFECSRMPLHMEHHGSTPDNNYLPKHNLHQLTTNHFRYMQWSHIVYNYTCCKLSKASDKLPALSGLAQRFSQLLKDQYIVGLWKNDLFVGLTWTVSNAGAATSSLGDEYIAPSWSWASANGAVNISDVKRNIGNDGIVLELIDVTVQPLGLDKFGQVTYASLVLSGKLITLKYLFDSINATVGLHLDDEASDIIATFNPDHLWGSDVSDANAGRVEVLLLWCQTGDERFRWDGIVLRPDRHRSDAFRRIGYVGQELTKAWVPNIFDRRREVLLQWMQRGQHTVTII